VTRTAAQAGFALENIDARVFFWPLSGIPMFEAAPQNTNAWSIADRAINLPSYHELATTDLDRVTVVLASLVG
jgi:perosamine synthetase